MERRSLSCILILPIDLFYQKGFFYVNKFVLLSIAAPPANVVHASVTIIN